MIRSRILAVLLSVLVSAVALAQKPADVLVSKIKKETAVQFTHKTTHVKTNARYAVVLLLVKPKNNMTDSAKVLGILEKKKGKWTVVDYVLGTLIQDAPKQMQRVHKNVPKSLYPKKV